MFGVFIFLTVFSQVVEQIMPVFVLQRTMYEARERPSKAYSWMAFLIANILVEMAWNSVGLHLGEPRNLCAACADPKNSSRPSSASSAGTSPSASTAIPTLPTP